MSNTGGKLKSKTAVSSFMYNLIVIYRKSQGWNSLSMALFRFVPPEDFLAGSVTGILVGISSLDFWLLCPLAALLP